MLVGEIMDRDITSLAEETTLLDAVSLMTGHNTSGLPVINTEGQVVGFLSEKDVLNAAIPGYFGYMDENSRMPDIDKIRAMVKRVGHEPARDYMSKECVVFGEFETVSNALMVCFRKDIRRIPVTREGMLIGVVDREKILREFVHDFCADDDAEENKDALS